MTLLSFSETDFLHLGLELAGHGAFKTGRTCHKTNVERFTSTYFAHPKTVCAIFQDLQTTAIPEARTKNPKPSLLLLALYYLKKYPTKNDAAAFLDTTEKTALQNAR